MAFCLKSFFKSVTSPKHIFKAISSSATPIHNTTQRAAFHHSPTLTMKVARITSWGSPPDYMTAPDLPAPSATQLQLKVLAAGVPRAVQGRALGKHPSAFNQPLPYDPSVDGVGLDEATGTHYFINPLVAPLFAEPANVDRSQLVKLESGVDPVTVAGLVNNVSSSWMALRCRAVGSCKDRTVVIVGNTSSSGRAAAQVARFLGAAKVVGLSRSEATLATVEGLDERVVLSDPAVLPQRVGPVHIMLDYVGGPTAIELMRSAEIEPGENLQYIQVGGLAGHENLLVPGRFINVKPIYVMASGIGSLSMQDIQRETPELVAAISKMKRPFEILAAPMAEVNSVWNSDEVESMRLVLIP